MREIPKGNYVKAAILFIATILVVFLLANYFIKKQEYDENSNTRMTSLTYISEESIEDYIVENHNIIVYVSDSSDKFIETEEIELNQLIIDNELEDVIVYMDSSKLSENFLEKYTDISVEPNIYIFNDGKVCCSLYNEETELNAEDVITFINDNWEV